MQKLVLALALTASAGLAHADEPYKITVDAPSVKKAQRGVVKIVVKPGAGFHVNKEYPAGLKVKAPDGVKLEKDALKSTDAAALSEQALEFDVAYTSTDAGKKSFTGDLKFAVCSASSCDPKRESISFTVEVK